MRSFFHKIEELNIGWNDAELDERVFYQLCERHRIRVELMPLKCLGFYSCTRKGKHYIAVDSRLKEPQATFVMFHEFAHYLMHSPSTETIRSKCGGKKLSRDEQEADAFASCALLPLKLLRSMPDEEVAEMYGMTFFLERLKVYERYGI